MAHNPLLGSRISLISKKNIRYEGTLYSINESDATVALQNVRAYGTEGRENESDSETFFAPQDQVHPYLLFRGCDIKDLHVHESSTVADKAPPSDPAIVSSDQPPDIEQQQSESMNPTSSTSSSSRKEQKGSGGKKAVTKDHGNDGDSKEDASAAAPVKPKPRRKKNPTQNKPKQMVGSGASLLNRKARGVVEGVEGPDKNMETDFDFEAEFAKEEDEDDDSYEEEEDAGAYSKDDFFDSISTDVLDRQTGYDNRLRGAAERNLNTETFGATSLGNNRRFRRRGDGEGRGRGRGDGEGRGRGRGRGRGSGRGGRGGRRQYGDGGISSNGGGNSNGAWRTVS